MYVGVYIQYSIIEKNIFIQWLGGVSGGWGGSVRPPLSRRSKLRGPRAASTASARPARERATRFRRYSVCSAPKGHRTQARDPRGRLQCGCQHHQDRLQRRDRRLGSVTPPRRPSVSSSRGRRRRRTASAASSGRFMARCRASPAKLLKSQLGTLTGGGIALKFTLSPTISGGILSGIRSIARQGHPERGQIAGASSNAADVVSSCHHWICCWASGVQETGRCPPHARLYASVVQVSGLRSQFSALVAVLFALDFDVFNGKLRRVSFPQSRAHLHCDSQASHVTPSQVQQIP